MPGGETAATEAAVSGELTEASEQAGGAAQFGGGGGGGGGGGFFGGQAAPRVEPGEYTVKVTVGKNEQTKKVVVEEDPRITMSDADRAARRSTIEQLSRMAGQASASQRSLTGLHTALNTEIENWKKPGTAKPPEKIQKPSIETMNVPRIAAYQPGLRLTPLIVL